MSEFIVPFAGLASSERARRVAEIRAWRDQTEGIYGLPHYPSDPPLVTNNKGWWRDVCDLLDVMDGKPARVDTEQVGQ